MPGNTRSKAYGFNFTLAGSTKNISIHCTAMFICFDLIQKVICKAYFLTSRHLGLLSCGHAYCRTMAKYIKNLLTRLSALGVKFWSSGILIEMNKFFLNHVVFKHLLGLRYICTQFCVQCIFALS